MWPLPVPTLDLLPYIILPLLVVITYWDSLKGDWLIDDMAGMRDYDGQWQTPRWHWGNALKKLRYEFGKTLNPQHHQPGQPTFRSNPRRHHRLSLYLASAVAILLYQTLSLWMLPWTAFLATVLFVVHPLGPQVIAWISGLGYLLGAFFFLMGVQVAWYATQLGWLSTPLGILGSLALFGLCQLAATNAMFQFAAGTVLLVFLGLWPFALVSGLIALLCLATTFTEAVSLRSKIFVEQAMGQTTRFYPKKLMTVVKTFAYYLKAIFFPKRMGLYHTYGYHYQLPEMELEDRMFWWGLLGLLICALGLWLAPWAVRLAILWFVAFVALFLNWITINQFVTERYAWFPAVGACLLVALYAPAWLFWTLFGVALMRTWVHLPTFANEWGFYFSNLFNFPQSEVAMGNIGVAFLQRGMPGACVNFWMLGAQTNPKYDVNWYNLANAVRSHPFLISVVQFIIPKPYFEDAMKMQELAPLKVSRWLLTQALKCEPCHMAKPWSQELQRLDAEIQWHFQLLMVPEAQRLARAQQLIITALADPDLPVRTAKDYDQHPQRWQRDMWEERAKKVQTEEWKELLKPAPVVATGTTPVTGSVPLLVQPAIVEGPKPHFVREDGVTGVVEATTT